MKFGIYLAIGLAAAFVALASGCVTRTSGMQSPLPHDYDGVTWRPLETSVRQDFTVAPAYGAVVENDPATDTLALEQRIENLPEDARSSELIEVRVAIRPSPELVFDRASTVVVRSLEEPALQISGPIADLEFDGEWVVIPWKSEIPAGSAMAIEIYPGSPVSGWEYGFTPGRAPYGGSPAELQVESGSPVQLSGSLGFMTIFEQPTDVRAVFSEAGESVRGGLLGDRLLFVTYAGLLVAGGGYIVVRMRNREGDETNGR